MSAQKLYLNAVQFKAELDRCLNCKNQPCMHACPVNCNPQEFINQAKSGNYAEAVRTIGRNNPLGQTCGLICPDKFCMSACTRSKIDFAINIPKVQATILENYRHLAPKAPNPSYNGSDIAIIGAGPAGMSAAAVLSRLGYKITIFEASSRIGGALNMIPSERLPHETIEKDWESIVDENLIDLRLNTKIDNPAKLLNKYAGIIIASGEPNCAVLQIPGEENCLCHIDYLQNPQKYKTCGRVAVIGGGCVAADCAFTAKANGASAVEMFVRRRLSDMRITRREYLELLNKQIDISPLSSPVKTENKDGQISLFVRRNRFSADKIEAIPDSTVEIPGYALIIKAVGSYSGPMIEHNRIIYAGDCKHGGSTIVEAIASGRSAAFILNERLTASAA